MRVVSLLPSATEILCAVGGRDMLVGRSHECDWPKGLDLPVLTGARTHGSDPAAIDNQVRDLLAQNAALYTLDADLLASLKPDLILTQDLCSVCSIDLAAVQRVVGELRASGACDPTILSLNPHTVEDVFDDVLRVGEAIGRAGEALQFVMAMQRRMLAAQGFVNPFDDGPVVGFLEWTEPLFVAGHWNVQLIERAGGRHPLNPTVASAEAGAAAGLQQGSRRAGKSIAVAEDLFAATRPEWLVLAPCGLGLDASWACVQRLAEKAWFRDLPAVRTGRVAVVDGNQYFNRPGPRLVEAFEWLVGWMQQRPSLVPPGFAWREWR